MEACECERDNDSNMLQALHLINGNSILRRVTDGNSRVAQLVKQHMTNEPLVEDLYLWALARKPTSQETLVAQKHFEAYGADRAGAAQDLMWALFNSRDFLLVH
jgi:arginine utilization protein RocB